jgi:tellurite resistance protein TerC
MPAPVEISPWHWAGFTAVIVMLLALDLGLIHGRGREVRFREALVWTALWFLLAMGFMGLIAFWRGKTHAVQFCTGYFIELSLSLDNVFVIALVLQYFSVPEKYQYRVLFWGILGALVMRGIMIALGVALISRFEWVLYLFGGFLIVTGIKMYASAEEGDKLSNNRGLELLKKYIPFSDKIEGRNFFSHLGNKRVVTPLFLALIAVEAGDLIFALDSVPAIFGVTRDSFIVFTSNVFAIIGLRSLYGALSGAMKLFRHLKKGLAAVLLFIGIKMLLDPHGRKPHWYQAEIPDLPALLFVVAIIGASICASVLAAKRAGGGAPGTGPP